MAIISLKKKTASTWMSLPDPSELKVSDELVWASNTGRTSSGTMVGDLKAVKTTVECKWNTITESEMATIRNTIKGLGGFFNVKYYDLGEYHTMTCYASGIPRNLYSMVNGKKLYRDITISFIEK